MSKINILNCTANTDLLFNSSDILLRQINLINSNIGIKFDGLGIDNENNVKLFQLIYSKVNK